MTRACYDDDEAALLELKDRILAHYRKAKAGSFESRPTIPTYTADDGSHWVDDPDGTHGSEEERVWRGKR